MALYLQNIKRRMITRRNFHGIYRAFNSDRYFYAFTGFGILFMLVIMVDIFLTGRSFRYFKVSKNVVIDIVIETIRNFTANMRHKSLCPPKYQFI